MLTTVENINFNISMCQNLLKAGSYPELDTLLLGMMLMA